MRRSGVLMPVSSLPSRFGIGGFSKEAYAFVDFLAASGQSLWQILPLGPTGYGDSPYQSFSTFAGSPYYISLDTLIEEGLLTEEECASVDFGNDAKRWIMKRFIIQGSTFFARHLRGRMSVRTRNIKSLLRRINSGLKTMHCIWRSRIL